MYWNIRVGAGCFLDIKMNKASFLLHNVTDAAVKNVSMSHSMHVQSKTRFVNWIKSNENFLSLQKKSSCSSLVTFNGQPLNLCRTELNLVSLCFVWLFYQCYYFFSIMLIFFEESRAISLLVNLNSLQTFVFILNSLKSLYYLCHGGCSLFLCLLITTYLKYYKTHFS